LNVAFKYYVESRELDGGYDQLYKLIVADQFKTGLSNVLREQVWIFEAGKWKATQEMAEQLDIFVSERDAYCPVDKSISISHSTTKVSNNNNNSVYPRNDNSNYKGNSSNNAVGGKASSTNGNAASSKFGATARAASNGSWRGANTQQGGG